MIPATTEPGRVVRLAARGDGVTTDGRYVALTAPGDQIDAHGIVHAGPHRQVPPCRHFPECGGCQLQHVRDGAFADFLVDRVASALTAQGLEGTDVRPPHLSPPRTRRRATLGWSADGKRVAIGFRAERTHRIVDMRECHVLLPKLFALIDPLRALLPGRGRAGQIGMTAADSGTDLTIAGAAFDGLDGADALNDFAARHRLARLSVDEGFGPAPRWEPMPVTVTLSGTPVGFPAAGFLQATADGEAALIAAVREAIGTPDGPVADLFAGLGTFALAVPGPVHAVEGARDTAVALKTAAAALGASIGVEHRDLFRRPLIPAELVRFAAVVLDPPRAGAREQVAELARSSVPRIAYVSCNPATFARDAKILCEGGFRLCWVQPVGQFRWSTHVELAGAFVRDI